MTTGPEQQRVAPQAATRLVSADVDAALDPFTDPDLLSEGKVNPIALDAIMERLGARWPQRQDHIYGHVERVLQRRLAGQGYHLRISETDFLICQPDLGRFSGQAACLQALREILTHFLGEAQIADSCVVQVTRVNPDGIEGWQVRASEVDEGERAERQASAPPYTGPHTVDHWTPFVASDGRELRVTCSLEPVVELKTYHRIGFRIRARVEGPGSQALSAAAIGRLSRSDILRIDLATVVRGLEELRMTTRGRPEPSLIVPVSFTTLSGQRGRVEFAKLLMEARGLARRGVICEMGDVVGVPEGVMLSVVSLVRPYCLFIVAHFEDRLPPKVDLSQLKRCGVHAFSMQCPPWLGDAGLRNWMKATIHSARRVVRSTLLYGITSPRHAALAAELGATHASFTA
jgi:hypothetical protein